MKYTLTMLYCNVPLDETIRLFELPELMYIDKIKAIRCSMDYEETVTLDEAFKRVAKDIHEDS